MGLQAGEVPAPVAEMSTSHEHFKDGAGAYNSQGCAAQAGGVPRGAWDVRVHVSNNVNVRTVERRDRKTARSEMFVAQ